MNKRFPIQQLVAVSVFIVLFAVAAPLSFAEVLSSPNYSIENPTVDFGGGLSTSTNYSERDSASAQDSAMSSSTNYKVFPGIMQHAYPGVPAQPTLTNTGGVLYNSLDFVVSTGGNASDAQYAIALSPDNFATTYYIQTDDTIATSTAWQTYTAWGAASGQRVTGLTASTTYAVKVKARFAADTETAYSVTAQATTVSPTFTMTISGVASGTLIAGATTTITTTANAISFSSLVLNTTAVAVQKISISTNASGGYTTTIQEDGNLRSVNGQEIAPVSGSNTSPSTFPTGISGGAFGYHTSDASLCTSSATRFSTSDTYAAVTVTPAEVACSATSVTSEDTYVVYKALIGSLQSSGSYGNVITYISSGKY